MRLELKIKSIDHDLDQLCEVLKYVRKNKPGYFTWTERIQIHQCRAAWMRALEFLAEYDPKEEIPEAATAVLRVAMEKHVGPQLDMKIDDIINWLQTERTVISNSVT